MEMYGSVEVSYKDSVNAHISQLKKWRNKQQNGNDKVLASHWINKLEISKKDINSLESSRENMKRKTVLLVVKENW